MPLKVHGTTYDSFDDAVKGVMKKGDYDEETAKKIVGKVYWEQEGNEAELLTKGDIPYGEPMKIGRAHV